MTATIPTAATRERIAALMDALDFGELAEVYCDQGGVTFFQHKRGEVVDLGCRWARALARRLPGPGRSLYAGAGVAELPVMLTEVLDLGRQVLAANLRQRECVSLNRSLTAVGLADRVQLQSRDALELAAGGSFDHLGAVSVLDDPETFPLVSAMTYGELHPAQLDLDALDAERQRVRTLAVGLWRGLSRPGVITTTAEEVPWFLECADRDGAIVQADQELIPTAIVGDPIGFLAVGGPVGAPVRSR